MHTATTVCPPKLHTDNRGALGQLDGLQSRTPFHIAYRCSMASPAAAVPRNNVVRAFNKLVRTVRSTPVTVMCWPQHTVIILGLPDVSFKHNAENSLQRGRCVFIAEARQEGINTCRESLVDDESKKIKRAALTTTVAELYACLACFWILS